MVIARSFQSHDLLFLMIIQTPFRPTQAQLHVPPTLGQGVSCLLVIVTFLTITRPASAQYLGPFDFGQDPIEYDARESYGSNEWQFGELRLPEGEGPFPVVVLLHGGCWQGLHRPQNVQPLAAAITEMGWATWNLGHRQSVDEGGGWTGTFKDVGAGVDYLRELSKRFSIDTTRVVTMGHSAGGHLALWAGARHGIESSDSLYSSNPLRVAGAVSLGGIPNLNANYHQDPNPCGDGVTDIMGGTPDDLPSRYESASPAERLPLGTPQLFLHGVDDYVVPFAQIEAYSSAAREAGDEVYAHIFQQASHFEMIAPASEIWQNEVSLAMKGFLDKLLQTK